MALYRKSVMLFVSPSLSANDPRWTLVSGFVGGRLIKFTYLEVRVEADDGDFVQKAMGSWGPWQLIICVAMSACKISIAWHQLAIIFLAPPQEFWCARPPGLADISVNYWRNVSSPPVHGHGSCHRYNFTEAELASGVLARPGLSQAATSLQPHSGVSNRPDIASAVLTQSRISNPTSDLEDTLPLSPEKGKVPDSSVVPSSLDVPSELGVFQPFGGGINAPPSISGTYGEQNPLQSSIPPELSPQDLQGNPPNQEINTNIPQEPLQGVYLSHSEPPFPGAPEVIHSAVTPMLTHPSQTTIPCASWEFDDTMFSNTIVAEWQLVCGQEMFVYVTQTVFMLGILVGNFVFGVLSDSYGRKKPLLASIVLQVIAGISIAMSTNFIMFCLLRFLDAFATGGFMLTTFVILMEIVGKKYRGYVAVIFHIPFAVGHMTLAGVAYYFRNWRHFQLAISLPSILLLSYYWLVPESPRWLLSAGRTEEATKILKTAARKNNLPANHVADMLVQRGEEMKVTDASAGKEAGSPSFLDLLRYSNLRKKTLCISFNWLCVGLCFFGLAQYMGTLAGNIFINIAVAGLIEIPGSFICMYTNEKYGRKKTLMAAMLTAGLSCFCLVFVPQGGDAAIWPTVALSSMGIVGMSMAFPTVYLYSGELFPTVVRNMGVGFASMCARIGSMAAPFVSGLSPYGTFLPPLIFAVFPIIGCLLCLFLPETLNTDLPETVEDGENMGKKIKKNQPTGYDNSNFQIDMEATKL